MAYSAEIIAVGTELLLGNIANTNARDLSEALSGLGINVYYHTVVGDNFDRMQAVIAQAKQRADIIITTGGLGPTYDDVTKEVLAASFGKKLVYQEAIAQEIRAYFANRVPPLQMTENNLRQAHLPEGATVLNNNCGTAPGVYFYAEDTHVIMLPGPPRECRTMFELQAVPILKSLSEDEIFSKNIRIFGMGESMVEEQLGGLMQGLTNPSLAPYAKVGEVSLRLTAKAKNQAVAEEMMAPILAQVQARLGDVIYGIDTQNLAQCALDLLLEKGKTLALAESCTGGLLGAKMTALPGASKVFLGGVVAYDNGAKQKLLDVPTRLLEEHGAVSAQVAFAMACGAAKQLGADFGIGITGIAGPGGGTDEKPVGLVYVALKTPETSYIRKLNLGNDRDRVRTMAANHALDMLRRYLTGKAVEKI